jgi:hypothetical protein
MANKRRRFSRPVSRREYRPVFIIATEGKETEPQYFNMKIFKPPYSMVRVEILPTKQNPSPASVLARMKTFLKEYSIKDGVQAWLIVDKDHWKDALLEQLYRWAIEAANRGLAVSNPQFEFWLLLHFEKADGVCSKADCLTHLRKHCPDYSKSNLSTQKFNEINTADAICRAYTRDIPPCEKWPLTTGSTIYRLVFNILYMNNNQ